MDRRYLGDLASCFAGPLIESLASGHQCSRLAYVAAKAELITSGQTLRTWLDELYGVLVRHYRCEYVFKNSLVNRLLLGRHSPNTSTMLFELRSADRIADAVLLNGTSHAFEIKTDLDGLERLVGQLTSYRSIFDKVHVLCSPANLAAVERQVPSWAGVLVLTKRQSLKVIRTAASNLNRLSPAAMFPTLRKPEYLAAVTPTYQEARSLPTGVVFTKCHEHFSQLKPKHAHRLWLQQLKSRGPQFSRNVAKSLVPYGLMAAFFATPISRKRRTQFRATLDLEVADYLSLPSQ